MGYVSFDLPANRIALAEQVSHLSCIMMVRIPRCTAFYGKFLLPFTCCHNIIVAPFSWNDLPFGLSSLCTFFFADGYGWLQFASFNRKNKIKPVNLFSLSLLYGVFCDHRLLKCSDYALTAPLDQLMIRALVGHHCTDSSHVVPFVSFNASLS